MQKKEISLIFNFADAPKQLQDAATAHNDNFQKLMTAQENLRIAKQVVTDLEQAFEKTEATFEKELDLWDAKTKKKAKV